MKKTKRNTIELYSEWYFQELKEQGFLIDWKREPETIVCADKHKEDFLVRMKTKNKVGVFNLFQEIVYTYDYRLTWHEKARYIFYDVIDINDHDRIFEHGRTPFIANYDYDEKGNRMHVTDLDVKPTHSVVKFGKTSTSITFPIKQRMIFDKTGRYINKFVPIPMAGSGKKSSMFIKTFTPKRYLLTDAGLRGRKIEFEVKDLNTFVHQRLKELKLWI